DGDMPGFATHLIDGRYPVAGGGAALRQRLAEICTEASAAIRDGARLLVLSDRGTTSTGEPTEPSSELAPIPSLLLTGAVHHHLIREKSRTKVGLIVESGDARECHHIALLIGFGASAVDPYLAIETVQDMARRGVLEGITEAQAASSLIKALNKGLLKIMSKMGVSTVASYEGAQIFEAVGLGEEVIDRCFAGTTSRRGGLGFAVPPPDPARRLARGFPAGGNQAAHPPLEV